MIFAVLYRLTPFYAVVLAFAATLWPHLGSGPHWVFIEEMSRSCRKEWWTHLLYFNNRNRATPYTVSMFIYKSDDS